MGHTKKHGSHLKKNESQVSKLGHSSKKIILQKTGKDLRAAPRKYQLDLEIAKKSNFSKLAQNEALRALVTKILF